MLFCIVFCMCVCMGEDIRMNGCIILCWLVIA